LQVVGHGSRLDSLGQVGRGIQKRRGETRLATGCKPASVSIPKRFMEITTWKGKVDEKFLTGSKNAYGLGILKLARKRTIRDSQSGNRVKRAAVNIQGN